MKIDLTKVCDCEVEGIDMADYPDFCDAYISKAWLEIDLVLFCLIPDAVINPKTGKCFRPLNDAELDWLNEQRDFAFAKIEKAAQFKMGE